MTLHFPDEFDEADRAFVASFETKRIPEGAIVDGYMAIISFVDPTSGESMWLLHRAMGLPISQQVGLLELSKIETMVRAPGAVNWRMALGDDEDD